MGAGIVSKGWVVTKNALGIPLHRVKIGAVFFQIPAGRCVYRSFVFKQAFEGKKFVAGGVTEVTDWYQRCR